MANTKLESNKLIIEMQTEEMNSEQIRLIRTVNAMLEHVTTTNEESEYFDGSSELLRLVANLIKKANFSQEDGKIQYSQQALEFCADILNDQIYQEDLVKYDN